MFMKHTRTSESISCKKLIVKREYNKDNLYVLDVYKKKKITPKIKFVTLNENFKKDEFSTFPQKFSTGCGKPIKVLCFALGGYVKIDKKQNFWLKLWKSMWILLETGKKIHCGKLFSRTFDSLQHPKKVWLE